MPSSSIIIEKRIEEEQMKNRIAAAGIAFMTGAFLLLAGCGGSSDTKPPEPTMPTEIKTEFFPRRRACSGGAGKTIRRLHYDRHLRQPRAAVRLQGQGGDA